MKRLLMGVCLLLTVGMLLSGCSGDGCKNKVLSAYNNTLEYLSSFSLTPDGDLKGIRQQGEDQYTGHYQAEYREFTGKEILFGGTALERTAGSQLTVTCKLQVSSGQGVLYLADKEGIHPILEGGGEEEVQIQLTSGDNYFISEGKAWTGSISITIS